MWLGCRRSSSWSRTLQAVPLLRETRCAPTAVAGGTAIAPADCCGTGAGTTGYVRIGAGPVERVDR